MDRFCKMFDKIESFFIFFKLASSMPVVFIFQFRFDSFVQYHVRTLKRFETRDSQMLYAGHTQFSASSMHPSSVDPSNADNGDHRNFYMQNSFAEPQKPRSTADLNRDLIDVPHAVTSPARYSYAQVNDTSPKKPSIFKRIFKDRSRESDDLSQSNRSSGSSAPKQEEPKNKEGFFRHLNPLRLNPFHRKDKAEEKPPGDEKSDVSEESSCAPPKPPKITSLSVAHGVSAPADLDHEHHAQQQRELQHQESMAIPTTDLSKVSHLTRTSAKDFESSEVSNKSHTIYSNLNSTSNDHKVPSKID